MQMNADKLTCVQERQIVAARTVQVAMKFEIGKVGWNAHSIAGILEL